MSWWLPFSFCIYSCDTRSKTNPFHPPSDDQVPIAQQALQLAPPHPIPKPFAEWGHTAPHPAIPQIHALTVLNEDPKYNQTLTNPPRNSCLRKMSKKLSVAVIGPTGLTGSHVVVEVPPQIPPPQRVPLPVLFILLLSFRALGEFRRLGIETWN
jgi:hypothetical protein